MEQFDQSIILVDNDTLHLSLLEHKLKNIGCENITTFKSYKDAAVYLENNIPDLVILDYFLENSYTGGDLVREFLLDRDIPVVFITSYYGDEIFDQIRDLIPMDFLSKSVSEFEFKKTIILALSKRKELQQSEKLKEFIFVKSGKEIKKIIVEQIEYISIDGKYVVLYIDTRKYLVRSTLNEFMKKLPPVFVKIHQSYIVNTKFIDYINLEDWYIKVGATNVPLSRNYKKDLIDIYYQS